MRIYLRFWWNPLGPIGHPKGRSLVKLSEGPIVFVGTDDTTFTLCSVILHALFIFEYTAWPLRRSYLNVPPDYCADLRLYCLHFLSNPDSLIHLWCCAVLCARRRCCFVASSCVAMRSYSRMKCESLRLCTPALFNDVSLVANCP